GAVVDSESWVLAIKKFSSLTAIGGASVRRRRLLLRITEERFATDQSARECRERRRELRWRRREARSDAELGLQQRVHCLRIGLAARRLHRLTDEPAHELRLRLRLRHLVG